MVSLPTETTMRADLQNPIFQDDDKAREALEAVRWPNGPVCPNCGAVERIARVEGKSHRPGLLYCNECKRQFTVTIGTVFERSKIGLSKWWLAAHLLGSSKKGMSAHQLHRMLGVTYKTAWFMAMRIREAMSAGTFDRPGPLGGAGKTVEADEAYIGPKLGNDTRLQRKVGGRSGTKKHLMHVFSLVERGGNVRTFHLQKATANTVFRVMAQEIAQQTRIMTDEGGAYHHIRAVFKDHHKVNHSAKEYVRGDAYTNTVEGYFSILKRGLYGTYQHVSEKHLFRYCNEFDFHYNNRQISDAERVIGLMAGAEGKRLTYRRSHAQAH